jgi:cytidine deaminase
MRASPKPKIDWTALVNAARAARRNAYAPYSRFRVGAAVLGGSGRIHTGCNVENSSYGLTICAERNAVFHAVAAGETRIVACAIDTGKAPSPSCGSCRQVFAEFGDRSMPIAFVGRRERCLYTLADLLPHAFDQSYF